MYCVSSCKTAAPTQRIQDFHFTLTHFCCTVSTHLLPTLLGCTPLPVHQPSLHYTLHEVAYDELYGKPQWFRDLHPQGLIPVIAYQQQGSEQQHIAQPTAASAPGVVSIKESLVCNEYLEDAYPQPSVSFPKRGFS